MEMLLMFSALIGTRLLGMYLVSTGVSRDYSTSGSEPDDNGPTGAWIPDWTQDGGDSSSWEDDLI